MKFADFYQGQVINAGPYQVEEAAILAFAREWDPQWFHTDAQAAKQGHFSGLIASGFHTCGIAMRLVVDNILTGSESFASPGLDSVRWPAPVRPGDSLSLTVTVLQTRVSASRAGLGVLRWRWQLHNQVDTEVLDLEATSLFNLKQN